MSGLPLLSGALHVTSRLPLSSGPSERVGARGARGGSSTSMTWIATSIVASPRSPSSALTLTEYSVVSS